MKIRSINILVLTLVTAFLSGCAVTDFDKSVDFASLRKFSWGESKVQVGHPLHESGLIDKKIKSVVSDEFGKRGIVEVSSNPDFLVSYTTHTEKKEKTSRSAPYYPMRWGFFPYSYFNYWAWGVPFYYGYPTEVREYTEGTLVLDIVDAKTKETVWRGSVSGTVDNPKAIQKQLEKGIKAIMKKYPTKPSEQEQRNILPEKDAVS